MIDWNSLTDAEQERITSDGLSLMLTVTEIAGTEQGMALWDDMSMTLGDDAKAAIFFAMLSGQGAGTIRVVNQAPAYNKVNLIKLIRTYTGLGLKEAKDISDTAIPTFRVGLSKMGKCRAELKALGCDIL